MNVHNGLAVTGSGVPIGLMAQSANTRAQRKADKNHDKQKSRPIEEKESFRWLQTLWEVHGCEFPENANVITVCDREGDSYEFFADTNRLNENILVRLVQDRMTAEGTRLFSELKNSEVKGTINYTRWTEDGTERRAAWCQGALGRSGQAQNSAQLCGSC